MPTRQTFVVQMRLGKGWLLTALTVVLYLQAATATLVGVASVLGMTGFAHTVVDGRRIGVGFWAFAVMLVAVVIPRIRSNNWLLIVPLAWTVLHLADSLFELLVIADPAFLPPVIVEAAFLIAYVSLLRGLSQASPDPAAR